MSTQKIRALAKRAIVGTGMLALAATLWAGLPAGLWPQAPSVLDTADACAAGRPCDIGEISDEVHKGLERINGRPPKNGHYHGDVYPAENLPTAIRTKYPEGVRFKETGFPDFEPYAMDLPNGSRGARIEGLDGKWAHDERLANEAMGFSKTPKDYTWHHVEDGEHMQLVPTDLHRAVGHTGGSARIRQDTLVPCEGI